MIPVLEVKNISKLYRSYSNEWQRIFSWFGLNFRANSESCTLQNINFSLSAGEAVGIIGQNGAGKSTLLKIITGTLKPTHGCVITRGRIAAILELGMGFHPDLTGRQNAYHSAGLMGYSHTQIDKVITAIEEFAEIGEYFDQPVRIYSSGMQMRVAFAVATAYRPEILIVDEALSVGDAYFQHKSFERIREFQQKGTTLLLVSHDKSALQAICDRAILIHKGCIIKDDRPEVVMDFYNALIAEKEKSAVQQIILENGKVQTISGTGEVRILSVKLLDKNNNIVDCVGVGDLVTLHIRLEVYETIPELVLGYMIKDRLGQSIYGTNTYHVNKVINNIEKGTIIDYFCTFNVNLGDGSYSITVAAHTTDNHLTANYEWRDLALVFSVVNIKHEIFHGLCWLKPDIKFSRNNPN